MRDLLSSSQSNEDASYKIAVARVEEEVDRWQCRAYMHITRPIKISFEHKGAATIHLETIFSKPEQHAPVPTAVVCVYFHLIPTSGALTYRFEQENVRHEVGGQSLADGMFEKWLDRIIGDKLQVRNLHGLATPFEESRLEPPPLNSEHVSEAGSPEEVDEADAEVPAGTAALSEATHEKLPLSTLLANIFDAADEEDAYELTHKEVADLLYATPLGLADWDIKLLITTALELETGRIKYKPFVQSAPEIIEALLKRRASYEERCKSSVQVTLDAIDLCYGEEIEEVARSAREAFATTDTGGKGSLTRHEFRSCLQSRGERFSGQEVQMLMQMCKEDDYGQVPYDELTGLLQSLRLDALHNALVETDVASLRVHLVLLCRREGLQDDVMLIWNLRDVLLRADQLCLSRMQIHTILSIVHPNEFGEVDVNYFLRVCCTVIPHIFDTTAFMDKAGTIAKDKADAQAKQELEELQGISGMGGRRRTEDEPEEDNQANAPDRDAVEKALLHVGNSFDDKHRQPPSLDVMKFLEAMKQEAVVQCQLSEAELRGFIAETIIDERREVLYVEHIKTWVPILFELRKSRAYDTVLSKDWGLEAEHLVDLSEFEKQFQLHVDDQAPNRKSGSHPSSAVGGGSMRRGRMSTVRQSSAGQRQSSRGASFAGQSLGRMSRSNSNVGQGERPGGQGSPRQRRTSQKGGPRPDSADSSGGGGGDGNASSRASSHAGGRSRASSRAGM